MNDDILEYLYDKEGRNIHRNPTEDDITSPGGIYRKRHPHDLIWEYIDIVAKKIGITSQSKDWDKYTIDRVNSALDRDEIDKYVIMFYTNYYAGAKLDLFKEELKLTIVSLYTKSRKGLWASVQKAILNLHAEGLIPINITELSKPDGKYGAKTEKALNYIYREDHIYQLLFKSHILNAMKTYYISLATSKPDKFLMYLKGWDNRINKITLTH